jgi:hypothetical protein
MYVGILALPFVGFWLLMYLGRDELGLKGILISVVIWGAILLGVLFFEVSPYLFVSAQAILDVILLIVIFGGDIK